MKALLLALLLAPIAAHAEPITLSHSGLLLGSDDAPVTDPARSVTFRIFDRESAAGQQLAWEATCPVAVRAGYYAVTLGDGCGTGLTTDALPAGVVRWLEVSVGTVVLTPRLRLGTAPAATLANRALDADKLGGLAPSAYAPAVHTHALADGTNAGFLGAADWSRFDAKLSTESDPKVGALTAGKWCTSNGSTVACTSDAPAVGGAQTVATLVDAPTVAVNGSLGTVFELTLGGNRTLGTPTNVANGALYVLRVRQDATGNRTLSYASGWNNYGDSMVLGTAPNALSILGYHAADGQLHLAWIRRGASACVPGSSFVEYTGAAAPFTVPAGCASLTVKAWGAGGASGYDTDDWGGGGGFAQGTLSVAPGDILSIIVGGGGRCGLGGFGGGGDGGGSTYQGGGGGRSAVRNAGGTELVTAGGGGGGSASSGSRTGGGGGGATGQTGAGGDGNTGGGGGTQTTPGAAGVSNNGGGAPQAGSQFQGGKGSVTGTMYGGGGGGGGYWGGGGGGGSGHASCCSGAGGGGGSGYVVATASGVQLLGASTAAAANAADADRGGAGQGGSGATTCIAGANGRVKLSWAQ